MYRIKSLYDNTLSDITLQIYYPAREKIPIYRDYKILGPKGLSDRMRGLILSKNRYGVANQVIGAGFYGEVGWFKELPLGKEISDTNKYLDIHKNIHPEDTTVTDTEVKDKKIYYEF